MISLARVRVRVFLKHTSQSPGLHHCPSFGTKVKREQAVSESFQKLKKISSDRDVASLLGYNF